MSLKEIEAELENLNPDELRHLALKSWTAFVEKEDRSQPAHECSEGSKFATIRHLRSEMPLIPCLN